MLELADAQEAYEMTRYAFELSEEFNTPVILRMTTRICHVKAVVTPGERKECFQEAGFQNDSARMVMTPANAKHAIPKMYLREEKLRKFSETCTLNYIEDGNDRRIGFITSGPTFMHVRESFADAPVLKIGLSFPLPMEKIREFASQVEQLVIVEEVEPIAETEIKAAGIEALGKEILPRIGELAPNVLRPAIAKLLGEEVVPEPPTAPVPPHESVARIPAINAPTQEELAKLIHTISHRVALYLERQGVLECDEDDCMDTGGRATQEAKAENSYLQLDGMDEDPMQ